MNPPAACPDQQVLYAFLLGQMAGPDLEEVAEHLEQCARCVERVEQLSVHDVVLDAARAPQAEPPRPDPQVRDVMEQLKQLGACVPPVTPPLHFSGASTLIGADDSQELPPPGLLQGRYRLGRQLGSGGMGIVYLAEDEQLGRPVAVKVPRFTQRGESRVRARQRFLREVRSAAQVRHPAVCAIHDVGEDVVPFVVMDYVEGRSLAAELEVRGRFDDVRAAVRLAAQVARALQAVHEHGVVHRDLKPGNILLDREDRPFLTDFGLALVEDAGQPITAPGVPLGTPAYMAPEQVTAQGPVDVRTDLYSLGLVLYQMLTGRLPFHGTAQEQIWQRFSGSVPPPSSARRDLDPSLDSLVLRALECEPAKRYASAAELAGALEAWLDGKATGLNRTVSRPRRRFWLVAAGLAVAAALLLAWRFWPTPVPVRSGPQEIDKPLHSLQIGFANRAVYSPTDSRVILSVPQGGVVLLDPKTKAHHVLTGHGPTQLWALAVSPDGRYLLTGGDDRRIVLWNLQDKKIIRSFDGHAEALKRVAFAGAGQIVSASDDGTVRTWDSDGGKEVSRFAVRLDGHSINATAFSDDGRLFLNGREDGFLELYETATGRLVRRWKGHDAPLVAVALSPDGKQALSAGEDQQLHCWSLDDFRDLALLSGHEQIPAAVAFVPGRPQVLSSDASGDVYVWDLNDRKPTHRLKLHHFKPANLLVSPAAPEVLSMSPEGELTVWQLP